MTYYINNLRSFIWNVISYPFSSNQSPNPKLLPETAYFCERCVSEGLPAYSSVSEAISVTACRAIAESFDRGRGKSLNVQDSVTYIIINMSLDWLFYDCKDKDLNSSELVNHGKNLRQSIHKCKLIWERKLTDRDHLKSDKALELLNVIDNELVAILPGGFSFLLQRLRLHNGSDLKEMIAPDLSRQEASLPPRYIPGLLKSLLFSLKHMESDENIVERGYQLADTKVFFKHCITKIQKLVSKINDENVAHYRQEIEDLLGELSEKLRIVPSSYISKNQGNSTILLCCDSSVLNLAIKYGWFNIVNVLKNSLERMTIVSFESPETTRIATFLYNRTADLLKDLSDWTDLMTDETMFNNDDSISTNLKETKALVTAHLHSNLS